MARYYDKKAHNSRSIMSCRVTTYVVRGNTQTKLMHARSRVITRNGARLSVTVDIVIKRLFSESNKEKQRN